MNILESIIMKLNESKTEQEIEYCFNIDEKLFNNLIRHNKLSKKITRKIYDRKDYHYLDSNIGCIRHDDGENFVEIKRGKRHANVFTEEKSKMKPGEDPLTAIRRVHKDDSIDLLGGYNNERYKLTKLIDKPFINTIDLDKITFFDKNKKTFKSHYFLEVEFSKNDNEVKEYIKEFGSRYNLKYDFYGLKKIPLLREYIEGKRK